MDSDQGTFSSSSFSSSPSPATEDPIPLPSYVEHPQDQRVEHLYQPDVQQTQQGPSLFTFCPFPKYSVNIVTGPTFVGKTYFVTQLVNHHQRYFNTRVDRVVVVLCNSRVNSISFSQDLDVPVEQVLLSDFAPDQLEDNDLVIIDDLQHLTPEVKVTISVCAHHQSLASLFVITHSLLGSKNFELLSLCHRIFLFLGSTANHRLTNFILDRFHADPEVRKYLKSVLNFCSGENEILALELSPVGHTPPILLAFSHILHLQDSVRGQGTTDYCFLYPTPFFGTKYAQRFASPSSRPVTLTTPSTMSIAFLHSDGTQHLPANTLIALPVEFVMDQTAASAGPSTEGASECADKLTWETTLEDIEDNIESYFPIKRWKLCKNLAKEILSNPRFCITKDGKYFHLVDKPSSKANLISFLGLATRKPGPNEKTKKPEWQVYSQHIRELLQAGTPRELFVNGLLLQLHGRAPARTKKRTAAAATEMPREAAASSSTKRGRKKIKFI